MKQRVFNGKIGTIPAMFHLRYNYKLEIGKVVKYKQTHEGRNQYATGVITKINPYNYLFITRM